MDAPVLYYMPNSENTSGLNEVMVNGSTSKNDLVTILVRVPSRSALTPLVADGNPKVTTASSSALNSVVTNTSPLVGCLPTRVNSKVVNTAATSTSPLVGRLATGINSRVVFASTNTSPLVEHASTGINSQVLNTTSPLVDCLMTGINSKAVTSTRSGINGLGNLFSSNTNRAVDSTTVENHIAASIDSVASITYDTTEVCSYVSIPTTPVSKVSPKPQVKRPANKLVTTLVFFDLETTGLGHEIGKSNVQITEISLIAMDRKEFEQSTSTELKDIRVIQKLCLCTRPRSMVSSGAARVTGLDNHNLVNQQPFNESAASAIMSFLTHLPKPICLLAHNGAVYDYPLLKAEFDRLSIELPSDILIADTLRGFRAVGVPVFPPDKKICKSVKFGKQGQVSYALANLHLYFFNKNPTGSHSSEGDCIALAKVCHRVKEVMLTWMDENCYTFETVIPMW